MKLRTKELILCALFCALTAVGAQLTIPIPYGAITLQLLFMLLAGLMLPPLMSFLSMAVYVLLGLVGLPIFTQGGGFWYVFQPSFGYLIGFCVGTFVTGWLAQRLEQAGKNTVGRYLLANLAGLAVVYAMGMVYYYIICNYVINTPIALWPLFLYCFLLAVPGDLCLSVLGAVLVKRVKPALSHTALGRV